MTYLLEFLANKREGFEYRRRGAGDGDNPLGTAAVRNVDFRPRLFTESFDNFTLLADNASHFLQTINEKL